MRFFLPFLFGFFLCPTGIFAQTLSLSGNWKIHPGDNPGWKADTVDDRNWQTTYVPAAWETTVLPGYDSRYVPLHVYLNHALDAVYDHLAHGKALPASQVVRTVPRGGTPGSAPAITAANVPPLATTPAAANAIAITAGAISIPD